MSNGVLFTGDKYQSFKSDGTINAGGTLTFYSPGTTNLKTVYSDQALTTPITNPVTLDSAGRATVFIDGTNYDLYVKDSTGTLIYSQLNVYTPPTAIASMAEWTGNTQDFAASYAGTKVSGTSFTVSTNLTSDFHVGRRVKITDGGSTLYGYITSSSYSAPNTTVNITLDSGSISNASITVYLSILRSDNLAVPGLSYISSKYTITGPWTDNIITDGMLSALGRFQVFTSSGTFTPTKTGTHLVLCIGSGGGGGAGAGVPAGVGNQYGPGGNGGGAGEMKWATASLTVGVGQTVTINAAGTHGVGGTGSGPAGTDGGNTTFGALVTAAGGKGGRASGFEIAGGAGSVVGSSGSNGGGYGGGQGGAPTAASDSAGQPASNATGYGAGGGGGGGASTVTGVAHNGGNGGDGFTGLCVVFW